jgi:WD40 repeat protein
LGTSLSIVKLFITQYLIVIVIVTFQHLLKQSITLIFLQQDLESKNTVAVLNIHTFTNEFGAKKNARCTALAWSADGSTLFAGYDDNLIRVWAAPQ